jgi:FtsP/CotA-like multicopper oxidase with cupredoxin domain
MKRSIALVAALVTVCILSGLGLTGSWYSASPANAKEPIEDILAGAAGKFKPSDVKAAAARQAAAIAKARALAAEAGGPKGILALPIIGPGDTPDYYSTPNWANSPPLSKFLDPLPMLWDPRGGGVPPAKCLPLAVPDTITFPGSDYYVIELQEYSEVLHSELPATLLRGYVQVNNGTDGFGANTVVPAPIRYLGPLIVAQKDRPVRVKFVNKLAFGLPDPVSGRRPGDLFLPVDTSVMGSGDFEINYDPVTKAPIPLTAGVFTQNRATLHLHGGRTPWISDGTPHQWITPAGETTDYPTGVSVQNVPDMWFDATGNLVPAGTPGATNDPGPGAQTFYWTNQQSSRLMFYHDHAWGITRLNVYAGEAAGYLITDQAEQDLLTAGVLPAEQIPLIIQDKTFVDPATITTTDPTWAWGSQPWSGVAGAPMTPVLGDLWWPHVYMPAQNPFNPDMSGINAMGRWMYGPWFWPPTPVCGSIPDAVKPYCIDVGTIPNPYYDPFCDPIVAGFCQPPEIPGTPDPSWGAEAFLDTMLVNGNAFPTVTLQPKAYRFRVLNAAHDRFMNLQFYQAVSKVGYTNPTVAPYDFLGTAPTDLTEVAMVPAAVNPLFPPLWPTDGREGGVPDPATAGPAFIQIGTEGGFLPAPVVLPNQPIQWNGDPTMFNVGNVLPQPDGGGTLILGPAERADVIVDFTNFAGKTLILYNDAPAAYPALDPHYDYYTGAPDRTDMGGYTQVLPGVGPNIRTVMQVRIAGAGGSAPANDYNPTTLATLQNVFKSTGSKAGGDYVPGVFAASQEPVIVAQKAYESTYNLLFPSSWPYWGLSRISDTALSFKSVEGIPNSVLMKPKSIHDEMGGTFDDFGRMSAKLGLEVPFSNAAIATFALQNYVDPSTEILDGTDIQIWKVTHNGVDTHPIHFHLFDVQVINRVGWDGFIRLPDPNELGWKDTVRIAPLEDTIVALRPVIPTFPFALPDSVRPLNPSRPVDVGDMMGFSQIDPTTGADLAVPTVNVMANLAWEYVWHCHILSHEENDMMRPIIFRVGPPPPSELTAVVGGTGVDLTWRDNADNETGFTLERAEDQLFMVNLVSFDLPPSAPPTESAITLNYTDVTAAPATVYYYRIRSYNATAPSSWSNTASTVPTPIIVVSPPAIDFGAGALFVTSPAQRVTVQNVGNAPLTLVGIIIGGTNAADFAQTNACGPTLADGAVCTIDVTFTPSATGVRTAALQITSNDPVSPSMAVPLSGSVTVAAASVAPASLTFAGQLLNTASGGQAVTLSNLGLAPLTIVSIGIAGANAGDFAQSNTCGASLAAGANCAITVTFTPTAAGPRSASLLIASNDPVNPSIAVPLSGSGVAPVIGVTPASLTFSGQLVGTTSLGQVVTLSNPGNLPLAVNAIAIAGANAVDFAQTNTCGASVAAGANCFVIVTFTPTAIGPLGASLNFSTNDPVNPAIGVPLNGTGIAPIASVAPASLTFAPLALNTTSPGQVVTLSNLGLAPLSIVSIGIAGANAGDFAQTNACGPSLAAGANCAITVTFTPSASGARAASLAIASNDPFNPAISVPLAGSGLAPLASVAPVSLTFPGQVLNTTSAGQAVTLSNLGLAPLNIASIGIAGANAGDFAQTNACGPSLAPGANCAITVTFTPTVSGARAASLVIASNDPVTPSLAVPLSGTGFAPAAAVAPATITFAPQLVGTTSGAQVATLSNNGNMPLIVNGIVLGGTNPANFSLSTTCGPSLAAGGSCFIVVNFTPVTIAPYNASVVITTNDTVNPLLSVALNGAGIAPIASVAPASLTFAGQLLNTVSTGQTVTLSNLGLAPLNAIGISIAGVNPGDFAQTNTCGPSLAPGASCPITVTFTPAAMGTRGASLTVASSDPFNPSLTVPLSGTGIAPIAGVTPATLAFGGRLLGIASAARTVTLSNTGTDALLISGIALTGANAADFAQVTSCGASLAIGATCTIDVTFTPSATGARTASLVITGNDPVNPSLTVAMTGTGFPQNRDFNGDRISDIFWRHSTTGQNVLWLGGNSANRVELTLVADLNMRVAGIGDFNGDAVSDILWRNTATGTNVLWLGGVSTNRVELTAVTDLNMQVAGLGDFNGDGVSDILWRHATNGQNTIWLGGNSANRIALATVADVKFVVAGIGDFSGDGVSDIFWRNAETGQNILWMSGLSTNRVVLTPVTSQDVRVAGLGDFNGDGVTDILWRNIATWSNVVWLAGSSTNRLVLTPVADENMSVAVISDYNGDGVADILWRNKATGANVVWLGGLSTNRLVLTTVADTRMQVQ